MINFIITADKAGRGAKIKGWSGLHSVNSKNNVVGSQMTSIKSCFRDSRTIYIYGFDNKKVENYFDKKHQKTILVYNQDYSKFGETYSLSRASSYLEADTVIMTGNSIIRPSMFKNFNRKQSQIFLSHKIPNELGCHINSKNIIEHICYELDNYITDFYYIAKKDVGVFRGLITNKKNKNCFIFEIINKMIDHGVMFYPTELKSNKLMVSK